MWDPDRSTLLVLFATNPVVSHGYGTTLADPVTKLRRFRAGGARVWVLDPRRTETAALADEHVALRAGTDHLVLAWLVRELLADGADGAELEQACRPEEIESVRGAVAPFDRARVGAATGASTKQLDALLAAVRAAPGQVAVMVGTGVMMSAHGLLTEWLRWVLLIITGSLDRGGAMRFNDGLLFPLEGRLRAPGEPAPPPPGPPSRPELSGWAGQYPCVAMADEIEAGNLRALVVVGGSPLTAFPNPAARCARSTPPPTADPTPPASCCTRSTGPMPAWATRTRCGSPAATARSPASRPSTRPSPAAPWPSPTVAVSSW